MQRILSILLVMVFSGVTVQAEIYSCRDNQGQLHLTDNLQSLPAECLGRTRTVQEKDPDNLNYVPEPKVSSESGADFQRTVSSAAREQKQKKGWLESLLPRVERAVAQYRRAMKQIYDKRQSGRLKYREAMTEAKEQKQQALAEKQNILAEMDGQKISRKDKAKIVSKLDEIRD